MPSHILTQHKGGDLAKW